MIEKALESNSLKLFCEALKQGTSLLVEELWDTPRALMAALAVKATGRSLLLLTGGVREDALFENLKQLAPDLTLEFPAWETLPGEEIRPSPDIIGKRFEALYALQNRKGPVILLCPLSSFLQKLPPPSPISSIWKKKDTHTFQDIPKKLIELGYRKVAVVTDKGEFAIRGGIVDLFPVSATDPFRIDFLDDEIETIRTFDPVGQKTIGKVDQFFLSPADEENLLKHASKLVSIGDYLGEDPLLAWDDLVKIEENWVSIQKMPASRSPFLFSLDDALKRMKHSTQIIFSPNKLEEISQEAVLGKREGRSFQPVTFDALSRQISATRFFHPFMKLDMYFQIEEGTILSNLRKDVDLLFLNATEKEEEEIKNKLPSIPLKASFERGYLSTGFAITDISFALIPNSEITHRTHIRRQKWRGTTHTPAAEFHQLTPGDLVVHFHSGIGKYLGMEKHTNHLGVETEFFAIEYADKSKLFVPLSQAYLISRYIGSREDPPSLSQIGGKRWQAAKQHAQAQIVGYASEMLQLYARREAYGGFRFPPDTDLVKQFEEEFPYQPTTDQVLAVDAIKVDMGSQKAMDRLVCGDVGYGKTEVAMRAAFKAVADGQKQVAVLVPTTVLAMQHFETFSARMDGFPITVDLVCRFRTPKEIKKTLQKVSDGNVDILIGTHRILSEDVQFKDLGLLIIDEEQRFGVRSKELLKKKKEGIDCLTLSATPIPRTLYLSLVSARDMSVIGTPPQDRLPVKTIIAETDTEIITNALLREFARGGQAFFIHNRVESIYERAEWVQKLVPSARIGVVHGQMDSDDIDPIFHKFKKGELDLLFATTIIENGIDIPNANTILIDRADTYGLADLYQLKGRVGRWNRAAYAYFLIPKNMSLSEITRKRLNALVEAGSYGGGMKIAMRDLEIRGAGDLLGVQQSGQVSSIGFHLYCKLLKRAIDAIKKQKTVSFEETKIEATFDARLPDSYIPEVSIRMELYYRLGEASTYEEIDELLNEIKDRFGDPPPPVIWLYHMSRLRSFATNHQFSLLKFGNRTLLAERQVGKEVVKRNMIIPLKVQTPTELEEFVTKQLKQEFAID